MADVEVTGKTTAQKVGSFLASMWSTVGQPIVQAKVDAETAKYQAEAANLRREAGIVETLRAKAGEAAAAAPAITPTVLLAGGVGVLALAIYLKGRQ